MRMHIRRFTRLTSAFGKKAESHAYAVAIHFMWYNFDKIHLTLRITPHGGRCDGSRVGRRGHRWAAGLNREHVMRFQLRGEDVARKKVIQ